MTTLAEIAEAATIRGVVPGPLAQLAVESWAEETGQVVDPATGEVTPRGAPAAPKELGQAGASTTPKVLPGEQLSATEILGTQAQDELLNLRGAEDDTLWVVGDKALELCAELPGVREVAGRRVRVTKKMVRAAIADTVGCQPSTVRQRERVSEGYPPNVRAHYEPLTYTHFREAMRASNCWVELQWCIDSADDYGGNPAPPRVLRKRIDAQLGKQPPPTPAERLDRAIRAVENYQAVAEGRAHAQATNALALLNKINQV